MTDEPADTRSKKRWALQHRVGGPGAQFLMTEQMALTAAAAIYSKAFLEAVAKRHADGVVNVLRTRFGKKGEPDEYHIGVDGGSAATIAITADTPDEARLALLDLDVTTDEVRGKLLRWDSDKSTWRPAD
jgi:hypothetical protein